MNDFDDDAAMQPGDESPPLNDYVLDCLETWVQVAAQPGLRKELPAMKRAIDAMFLHLQSTFGVEL
jgi:hypothetical protein